jgi:hypothetical protein
MAARYFSAMAALGGMTRMCRTYGAPFSMYNMVFFDFEKLIKKTRKSNL